MPDRCVKREIWLGFWACTRAPTATMTTLCLKLPFMLQHFLPPFFYVIIFHSMLHALPHLSSCSYQKAGAVSQVTLLLLVYNTGAERDHICRTWGQYNFETFDGLYYYFSGKSTYALVRHAELDEQSFSIQVGNGTSTFFWTVIEHANNVLTLGD